MRNQKVFRQAKVKRLQYHQTSCTSKVEGTYIVKKYKRRKTIYKIKAQTIKKMAIRTNISLIILNVNGLNVPTKRHRLAEWIEQQDPYIRCLQKFYSRSKYTYRLKVSEWKNIFHANGKQKKAGVAILMKNST